MANLTVREVNDSVNILLAPNDQCLSQLRCSKSSYCSTYWRHTQQRRGYRCDVTSSDSALPTSVGNVSSDVAVSNPTCLLGSSDESLELGLSSKEIIRAMMDECKEFVLAETKTLVKMLRKKFKAAKFDNYETGSELKVYRTKSGQAKIRVTNTNGCTIRGDLALFSHQINLSFPGL